MANQTHLLKILIESQDKASKALGGLGNILTKGVTAGAVAATAAVAGLGAVLAKSVQLAGEQEKVEAQLAQTLESTRHAAGLSAAELKTLASEYQNLTTYGDEAIIGAENLLLTFTNIKGPVFEGALSAILDMSTALGQDLKTSAIQVGKALQDPVAGLSALRRVGIQLSEAQEETIKNMVEMGDVAGAQAIILQELNTQFGGSATAAAGTYQGRIQQLKNAIGDMGEQIGFAVVPALTDLAEMALPKVQAAIDKAKEAALSFASSLKEALAGDTQLAIQDFQKGLTQLGFPPEQVESISESAVKIGEVIGQIGEALGQIDAEDISNTVGAIVSLIEGIAGVVEKVSQAVEIGAGLASQIGEIQAALGEKVESSPLGGVLGGAGEGIQKQGIGAMAPFGGIGQVADVAKWATQNTSQAAALAGPIPQVINLVSTINLDGKEVGKAVGQNIGEDAGNLAAVGGHHRF